MVLPDKNGWLIDFVSARAVFEAHDNQLVGEFTQRCESGSLFCCRCEGDLFKSHDGLRPPFVDDQDCRIKMTDAIIGRLEALAHAATGGLNGKRRLPGDTSQYIVATAIEHDFGVISNKTSDLFITTTDLCLHCGVVALTTEQFKHLL